MVSHHVRILISNVGLGLAYNLPYIRRAWYVDTTVNRAAFLIHTAQSDWEVRLSNSRGVPYFYNTVTQQSVWETPEGLTKEQIDALPGASLLKPKEVRASHILVKHSGSRRPSSWKEASIHSAPL